MNARKIIIDCDPGIDDSLAIMLALSIPEIEVIGITTVSGNIDAYNGAINVLKILELMNRLDIPVYIGENKPLYRDYVDAKDTHGEDGLGETFWKKSEISPMNKGAVEYMEEILDKNKDISIICLGPLTNLACLYKRNKKVFTNIFEIITMGGNYRSHGNCSPVAEYNYWCDPESANIVYEAFENLEELNDKLIHMVGLDVTRKIVLTPNLIQYMKKLNTKIGNVIEEITKFYIDFHWKQEGILGCVINDPLAVAYFFDREICSGFDAYTYVETEGKSYGQTIVDKYGIWKKKNNSRVLVNVDVLKFMEIFMTKIFCNDENIKDMITKIMFLEDGIYE